MIESEIDAYKAENTSAQIKLKSCKVKDGVVNVLMEYGDYQAYAGYNGEIFFTGTIQDANMAGFDLNVTLSSVSDGTTASKPELLGMGDSHIVIIGYEEEPEQPEQLPKALETAFAHDTEIVLEEAIPGFEVGCAVMGNETLTVGAVDEIELSAGFFSYDEKYTLKSAKVHCPARIPSSAAEPSSKPPLRFTARSAAG